MSANISLAKWLTRNIGSFKKSGHTTFFIVFNGVTTCLICKEKIAILKDLKRHYTTKYTGDYDQPEGEVRERKAS